MRNLSFFLTKDQFLDGSKTVTRRLGWHKEKCKAVPGMELLGVEKGQGLGKGGKVNQLGKIVIVSVRREPLMMIDQLDVIREGFPEMDTVDFVTMFCKHQGGDMLQLVTRIEFDHSELHQDRTPCRRCKGRHALETITYDQGHELYCPNCCAVWLPDSEKGFVIANPKLEMAT